MSDKKENICALCRFCTFEESHNSMVCHNESSKSFGKDLDDKQIKAQACDDFTPHKYHIPLKEALKTNTQSDDFIGAFYHHKLPEEKNDFACVTLAFKTNAALEEWKDAHMSLFFHWLEMAKKDGDVKEEEE
ncbi:MAG: hypothetical protein J6I68_11500 [Butyrivibrio sp.]|uniref:hypothetical protein n=1 Tax=Butyrivibrio sp. TaxID=28121 RepID=UPI001B3F826D|nr:hypothetical protein [Butyrivibrio sp.]MBP3783861.1 hypothetical protein [Butyrivibrio sp.]